MKGNPTLHRGSIEVEYVVDFCSFFFYQNLYYIYKGSIEVEYVVDFCSFFFYQNLYYIYKCGEQCSNPFRHYIHKCLMFHSL